LSSFVCKREKKKKKKRDERCFVVVVVVVVFRVRGILRAPFGGENRCVVFNVAVGDVGGVEGADAVGEAIRHAMRVFTGKCGDTSSNDAFMDEERMRIGARDGFGTVNKTQGVRGSRNRRRRRWFYRARTLSKTRETSHRERFRGFRRRHGERKRRNEEEQQQEVDVGLKAKECDNCEGGGMIYSPTYYGSDSECDECNGTGKIVTASIEGVLFKVSINSIKEVD